MSGRSLEEMLVSEIAAAEQVGQLTRNASLVSALRTTRDWSYICNRFHGPGWALAGDAAAFVDPLFSTGVTLAMRSASQVAKAVGESLRDPAAEEKAMAAYDDSHRAFFEQVLQFVRFFYNRAYSKEQYWAIAQSIIDPDMVNSPKIDFATFLSGLFGAEPNPEAMQEVMSLLK